MYESHDHSLLVYSIPLTAYSQSITLRYMYNGPQLDNINVLNQHLTPVLSAYSHQPFQPIHIYALAATATYTTTTLLPLLLSLLLRVGSD